VRVYPIEWYGMPGGRISVLICSKCEKGACETNIMSNSPEPQKLLSPVQQFIVSPNGKFRLIMQSDGNLVLFKTRHYHWIWGTHTSHYRNYAPFKFVVQEDGNMVLYDKDGKSRWDSKTQQEPKEVEVEEKKKGDKKKEKTTKKVPWKVELTLQDDGNLVLYREDKKVLWSSKTAGRKDVDGADHASLTGGKATAVLKRDSAESRHGDLKMSDREDEAAKRENDERLNAEKAAEAEEEEASKTRDVDYQPKESAEDDEAEERGGNMGGADAADEKQITYGADPLSSMPDADETVSGSKLHTQSAGEAQHQLPVMERQAEGERRKGLRGRSEHRQVKKLEANSEAFGRNPIQQVIDSLV